MWVFTMVILITILPPIYYKSKKITKSISSEKIEKIEKAHVLLCFIALFFISSFRGDFTTDYSHYVNIFYDFKYTSLVDVLNISNFFSALIHALEPGYTVLNIILGKFTDNYIWLFIVCSIIVLFPIFKSVFEHSEIKWFSILFYIILGTLFDSFNIMRQIMATSIVFAGTKHLYKKEYFKFLLYVALGSTFHISSIFMAIFYFILQMKPLNRAILVQVAVCIIWFVFLDEIISIVDRYLFSGYYTAADNVIELQGRKFTNAVIPFSIGMFIIFFKNILDSDNVKHIIWFNGTLLWVTLKVLSIRVHFIDRIAAFFFPFTILIVPAIITRISGDKIRKIIKNDKIRAMIQDDRIRICITLVLALLLLLFYFGFTREKFGLYYTMWKS